MVLILKNTTKRYTIGICEACGSEFVDIETASAKLKKEANWECIVTCKECGQITAYEKLLEER